MKVTIREPRPGELRFLQAKANQQLPEGYAPIDLGKSVVYVAEDEGITAGVVAAHRGWQIEPLLLFPEFVRYAPGYARKDATYRLARAIVDHLNDPARNEGSRGFFAHVSDPTFRNVAVHFGLHEAYDAGVILKGGFE